MTIPSMRLVLLCAAPALLFGCLSPPMLGPHGVTAKQGGPLVVVPFLVSGDARTPLRSVLAWTGEDVRVRMPDGRTDVMLRVRPEQDRVTVEDTASGLTASGPFDQPLLLDLGGTTLELTVEYP